MRGLLILLFSAACIGAAAAAVPCDKSVRFSAAWFGDPELDNSKSAAELSATDTPGSGGGTQLGHVVVETKLSVVPQTSCAGLLVRLEYIKPVLRVAKEFPPDSCAYARVMNHEQTHVRIHRDIARQFRELDYPWGGSVATASVLAFAKLELDRLMQAQVLFDSPQEYARNHTVCGGEISRLVKPAAPPAPPAPRAPAR
jgi:hypothetical protein